MQGRIGPRFQSSIQTHNSRSLRSVRSGRLRIGASPLAMLLETLEVQKIGGVAVLARPTSLREQGTLVAPSEIEGQPGVNARPELAIQGPGVSKGEARPSFGALMMHSDSRRCRRLCPARTGRPTEARES